jgi:prepilin-type N-terminal cleavage/methylation domain-containing protein
MPAATPFSADPLSRSRAGFSLIEIILAVAVIAFALTAILGLFPVAVGAATDSQRETQAALIARSILDQLAPLPAPNDKLSQITVTVKTRSPNISYPFTTLLSQK